MHLAHGAHLGLPCVERNLQLATPAHAHAACTPHQCSPAPLLHMDSDTPLLCSSCSILGKPLWRTRARLYRTHIELSGWSWTGQTVHRVPLDSVESVRWWGGKQDINLELTLTGGAVVALYLEESAGTWNYTLRRLRTQSASEEGARSTGRATSSDLSRGDGLSERTAPRRVGIAPS